MNLTEALRIFNISKCEFIELNDDDLRKLYKKMARKCHPDKNVRNPIYTHDKFQKLGAAYEVLQVHNIIQGESANHRDPSYIDKLVAYVNTFYSKNEGFVNNIMSLCRDSIKQYVLTNIKMMEVNELYKLKSLFDNKTVSEYIDNDVRDIINNELRERISGTNRVVDELDSCTHSEIIIDTNITDILDSKIYIHPINNVKLFVPLWHSELYFDSTLCGGDNNTSITVIVHPILPDNMYIDDTNNLHVYVKKPFDYMLLFEDTIDINIGDTTYPIPISSVHIEQSQIVTLKEQGPASINHSDVYDIQHKCDILVHISFVSPEISREPTNNNYPQINAD